MVERLSPAILWAARRPLMYSTRISLLTSLSQYIFFYQQSTAPATTIAGRHYQQMPSLFHQHYFTTLSSSLSSPTTTILNNYSNNLNILYLILSLWISWKHTVSSTLISGLGSEDEEKLIIDKFRGYNHLIRPVDSVNASPIIVDFGVAMILLINVDEKNQIMQTNVWLTMTWEDYQMRWQPRDYGGITTIRVPPDKVWLPDIVLFNNADGRYEVSFHSNVVVSNEGRMLWVPPAIYKSSCRIDVEFFPFDEQTCSMSFGSWTYGPDEVQLTWYNNKQKVELNDYSFSGIWDIMDVPGQLKDKKSKIDFNVIIRRKTLFYTVILIIPTVLMAFLSMMVFYLPADCSEKITLAISILLALVVFLLLVSKILPPTSDTIPLMAKYLLMTFVMNIITILVTVVIINIYFRGPTTHRMPTWVRTLFLKALPRLLFMKRPKQNPLWDSGFPADYWAASTNSDDVLEKNLVVPTVRTSLAPASLRVAPMGNSSEGGGGGREEGHHPNCRLHLPPTTTFPSNHVLNSHPRPLPPPPHNHQPHSLHQRASGDLDKEESGDLDNHHHLHHNLDNDSSDHEDGMEGLSREARRAILAIQYISDHLKAEDTDKKTRDDWKYVAMIIDRLLLYVFFGVTLGGTLGILLSAPNVFSYVDQAEVIARLTAQQN